MPSQGEGVDLTVAWHKVNSLWQEPEEQVAWMLKSLGKKNNPLPSRSAKESLSWEIAPLQRSGLQGALARQTVFLGCFLPAKPHSALHPETLTCG